MNPQFEGLIGCSENEQIMRIYHVTQVTWNDGQMSDFNLPRDLGYYVSLAKAEAKIDSHLRPEDNQENGNNWENGYTTMQDYAIEHIDVIE